MKAADFEAAIAAAELAVKEGEDAVAKERNELSRAERRLRRAECNAGTARRKLWDLKEANERRVERLDAAKAQRRVEKASGL